MNTTTTPFLRSDPAMYTSPGRTYARVGIRDPARMYTYVAVFLSCTLAVVRTCTCYVRASTMTRTRLYYDTCAPLHPPVYMYVHVRNQNDNATYASTRWVPTVTHLLACEDVTGASQQSGGQIIFFARTHFIACEDVAGGSQQSGGKVFFAKYGGPFGGSPLSGGGIIILRVIRRHFLAAVMDPAVSLSTYSPRPMEAVP